MHFKNLMHLEIRRRNGKSLSAERPIRKNLLWSKKFKLVSRVRLTTSLSLSHQRFNCATWTFLNATNRQSFASRYTDMF